jgi:uncharacterized protein YecE (DUF72 family)
MSRAERRQKQREANPARAKKMHEARIKNPALHSFRSNPPLLNIGCSGWFYWGWRGVFYPENMPTKNWFAHYAKHFDTVELNAPFYSWPTVTSVHAWLRQAGQKEFVYTVKVSELITHVKKFNGTKGLIRDFGYIADLLGERMGCFLFQLPPSFHYTPARLKRIIAQLDTTRRNVVEFRHKSWWNEDVYESFRKAGIIFCSCSGPKLPDTLVKTSDEIYVRFHGPEKWYKHNYSLKELSVWATRIQKSNAKRVWVYFNNDYGGYAIQNAKQLKKLLKHSNNL